MGCIGCCGGRSYCLAFFEAGATAPQQVLQQRVQVAQPEQEPQKEVQQAQHQQVPQQRLLDQQQNLLEVVELAAGAALASADLLLCLPHRLDPGLGPPAGPVIALAALVAMAVLVALAQAMASFPLTVEFSLREKFPLPLEVVLDKQVATIKAASHCCGTIGTAGGGAGGGG